MAGDGEQGFALDQIVLPAEAPAAFRGIADMATLLHRGAAFSSPVGELQGFDPGQCIEIGPAWHLPRMPRSRASAWLRAA